VPPFRRFFCGAVDNRMATKFLNISLPEDLYREFINIVTEEKGRWRGQESFTEAINSAAAAALMVFLQDLEPETNLPEFRDYAKEKYPELDEGLITMVEDMIERKKQSSNR
jgi:hypothetical protein